MAPPAARLTRRALLRAAGRAGLGAAGLALVGCGGDDDEGADALPVGSALADGAGEPAAIAARPAATPQRGGHVRLHTSLDALDFFDIHRSQFPVAQQFSTLQQSKLIRYADIDAGLLEADLAALPEIPDEATYVFTLRPDVLWSSGAPVSGRPFVADDVRLNVERQIAAVDAAGAHDPLFARQAAYAQTAALETIDSETLLFRTNGPIATYLTTVHAGPWAFIQAPEVWAVFGDLLRDEPLNPRYYSGTGPFQIDQFRAGTSVRFRRNPSYFRPDRPLLDSLTFIQLAPGEEEAAYRGDAIDAWSPGDARTLDAVLPAFPDHRLSARPLPFAIQAGFNHRRADEPSGDPRLLRAIHLALGRRGILRAAYGRHARPSGAAPWYAEGWALDEAELSARPGYGDQPSASEGEALRQLVDAVSLAGPLALVTPDVFEATYPGIGAEIGATLSERLGIEVAVGVESYARIFESIEGGENGFTVGWGAAITDADPTDLLLHTVYSSGPGNRSGYANADIDQALERMRVTLDLEQRREIFHEQVQPILLDAPAGVSDIGHGLLLTLHRPAVHLPGFGFGWDGHRYEQAWREPSV